MEGIPAIYLGRQVSKENFRVFIYSTNGSQKLIESWDSFESHMQSGLWFATIEDAQVSIPSHEPIEDEKPKYKSKSKSAPIESTKIKDDFLPKG